MYIYILKLSNGNFYTGKTKDPLSRFNNHARGSMYTKRHSIENVVYIEEIDNNLASARETAVKKLTQAKKIKLINSTTNILKEFNI